LPKTRRIPDDDEKVQRIEKLEREIIAIRRAIGEPVPGDALAIPHDAFRQFDKLGVLQNNGEWIRMVRDAILRIDAVQTAGDR
jgi:hypothetical protein